MLKNFKSGSEARLSAWTSGGLFYDGIMKVTPTLINDTLCECFYGKDKIPKDGIFCGGFFDSEGESISVAGDFEKGGLLMCQDKPEEEPDSFVVCGLKSEPPMPDSDFICDLPYDSPALSDPCPMTFTKISDYLEWIHSVLDDGSKIYNKSAVFIQP
jgi:hypothetical protein